MSSSYFEHHHNLINELLKFTRKNLSSNPDSSHANENQTEINELLQNFEYLAKATSANESFIELGTTTLCKIVATHSTLMPHVNRDLFWFFGGDCLHYMPDEEIRRYQLLEDQRYEAEKNGTGFDYSSEKAKLFGFE